MEWTGKMGAAGWGEKPEMKRPILRNRVPQSCAAFRNVWRSILRTARTAAGCPAATASSPGRAPFQAQRIAAMTLSSQLICNRVAVRCWRWLFIFQLYRGAIYTGKPAACRPTTMTYPERDSGEVPPNVALRMSRVRSQQSSRIQEQLLDPR